MLMRVPLKGTGTLEDGYTVDLPTCRVLSVDYTNMRALVDVPSDDAPDEMDAPGTVRRPILNGVPVLIGLTLAQRIAWRLKLLRRWRDIRDLSNVDVT